MFSYNEKFSKNPSLIHSEDLIAKWKMKSYKAWKQSLQTVNVFGLHSQILFSTQISAKPQCLTSLVISNFGCSFPLVYPKASAAASCYSWRALTTTKSLNQWLARRGSRFVPKAPGMGCKKANKCCPVDRSPVWCVWWLAPAKPQLSHAYCLSGAKAMNRWMTAGCYCPRGHRRRDGLIELRAFWESKSGKEVGGCWVDE